MYRVLDVCLIGLLVGIISGCGGSSAPSNAPSSSSSRSGPTAKSEATEAPKAKPSEVAKAPIAGGWGHLKGKFVYDGTAPKAPAVQVTKDQNFCGEFGLVDENLLVNAENKGLANVVVYLYLRRGATAPEIHESYAESVSTAVNLDNKNCRFEPHVSLVRTSQALHVTNSDQVGHNTKIDTLDNPASNLTVPAGGMFDQQFTARERRPAAVSCSIHPWMKGWLIVQDSPYAAVTNKDGEFEISNLPSGNWTFQVWHEAAGNIDEVKIGGESAKWSKGRVDVAIQPDETTDLGELKVFK
jgi:plastocyanin